MVPPPKSSMDSKYCKYYGSFFVKFCYSISNGRIFLES